jgi:hypothetical protein
MAALRALLEDHMLKTKKVATAMTSAPAMRILNALPLAAMENLQQITEKY